MTDVQPDERDASTKEETMEIDSEQTLGQEVKYSETMSKTNDGKAESSKDKTYSETIDVSGSLASSSIEASVIDEDECKLGEICADDYVKIVRFCELCAAQDIVQNAEKYCPVCDDELMCDSCSKIHNRKKATKSHVLLPISKLDEEEARMMCQPCTVRDDKNQAMFVCPECNDIPFCSDCANVHHVASESHALLTIEDFKAAVEDKCSLRYAGVKSRGGYTNEASPSKKLKRCQQERDRPGKPRASDIGSDTVTLSWEKPADFRQSDYFQIGYKDLNGGRKWRFYQGEFTESTVRLTNLKSDTKFVFRVRVYDDIEGPYSEESDEIVIASSLASRLVNYAVRVDDGDSAPALYALPMTEVAKARNQNARTRKFEIGTRPKHILNEKTIMMIGETGTGKSTLVDGMANYILSVNWDDPFRFTIINLEEEEKQRTKNQALSQTEWVTCYTIHPEKGSRLSYSINIIDTPGFGDTRGIERDQEIVNQIREMFSKKGPKGVLSIDAICFLIKAPDARLTPVQSYIFQSIMSIFGKDIENNICSLITFADGVDPPVLAALLESGLPFGTRFTFNNSGLFAKNVDVDDTSLAPMFWDMGMKGFRNFFQTLDTMSTKSLQMTSDVLYERNRLEVTIKNLEPKLDAGLSKVNQLKAEIKLFADHKADIADNKDFEYTVSSTRQVKKDLPRGQHVTNCTHCHFTCHDNCAYANDDDKINCSAMSGGYCTNCPDKCFWKQHANTPYIFTYITVEENKTYGEMKAKYEDASGKLLTQEQLLEEMGQELEDMIDVIEDMMIVVRDCNARLAEIALRPNPLTMVDHIDLMIENEKMHKKQRWLNRVRTLQSFRKRALIQNDVETFHREAHTIGVCGKRNNRDQKSVFQRIRDVFHW
ncbi:uncharacterized protein LOC128246597 isoform X2 [Mya arenaria]|nr:uncharacterized protein LOC128246597 isoform X2 [Mya arenaria]XP_052821024.1 uncharacterized protein LOC128246597 isoform X2 [Mya arenaria]